LDGAVSVSLTRQAPVTVAVTDGVATITLDSPGNGNAIGLATADGLSRAIERCQGADVRAVLLTANGRSFCVGGDLREFAGLEGAALSEHLLAVTSLLHKAILGMTELGVPVVASVNGNIAGAGVSLMCAADLVVAAADVSLSLAYTAIGYTPDGGASWLLPRIVGHRRALELLLLNRRLTADEALDWGLVTLVVPSEQRAAQTDLLVGRLAAGAATALGATKRLVVTGCTSELPAALDAESRSIARSASSVEGLEGVSAFLTKRHPVFRAS
jgi:2-(1,2-epoxy-1,2-dihydrophenyl)acetyl-CoA isomerase